jgi:hypothetical protein
LTIRVVLVDFAGVLDKNPMIGITAGGGSGGICRVRSVDYKGDAGFALRKTEREIENERKNEKI